MKQLIVLQKDHRKKSHAMPSSIPSQLGNQGKPVAVALETAPGIH
jgi:hypothetical protein